MKAIAKNASHITFAEVDQGTIYGRRCFAVSLPHNMEHTFTVDA